ncbi:MAG: ribosome biogenesis GTP-binding protein YsxC [Acidobacteria bacterium]|nr:ribosome biogenesis GTP-binding protein YsxC [Acidobacteriota bacterium]
MKIVAEFVTSAAAAGDFPRDRLAEVALVGRSNVGKSSLINALARRKVARTSAAPGKTRLANFYRVQRGAGPVLYLVDLPGYGYARGGDGSAAEFNRLTEAYFDRGREGTRIGVLLLVDARHPGLESDVEAWGWLRSKPCSRGIVGTKADKLTRAERARHGRELESLFDGPVSLVSAQTGEGLEELWKLIATLPNRTAP